jgi:hypothetical protein
MLRMSGVEGKVFCGGSYNMFISRGLQKRAENGWFSAQNRGFSAAMAFLRGQL